MKMSNRILLSIIFLFLSYGFATGRNFKILYVSSPDAVSTGGKPLCTGDIFSDNDSLIWKDGKQVIKVSDMDTKKQYIICPKNVTARNSFSLSDYFFLTKPLASRSGRNDTLQELSTLFQGDVVIDNHLVIPTSVKQDSNHFFYLACQFPEGNVNKAIPPTDGYLVLCCGTIFKVDGIAIPPYATQASLYYYDAEKKTSICVSRDFTVVPVFE